MGKEGELVLDTVSPSPSQCQLSYILRNQVRASDFSRHICLRWGSGVGGYNCPLLKEEKVSSQYFPGCPMAASLQDGRQ